MPLVSLSLDVSKIFTFESYFCNQIERGMNFGVVEVAPGHSTTSSSYLTSEPSQAQVFSEWRTLFWKGIYTAMMTELQAVQYLAETILFCLEASIHFKICTWRQIIVNLKAKDYSFERYINSENRVVSLWYSIWRVESRGKKIQSAFLFLRGRHMCYCELTHVIRYTEY